MSVLKISGLLMIYHYLKPWVMPSVFCFLILHLRAPTIHLVFRILSLTLQENLKELFEERRRGISFGIKAFIGGISFIPFYYVRSYLFIEHVIVTLILISFIVLSTEVTQALFLYAKEKSKILREGDTIDLTNLLIKLSQIIIGLIGAIFLLNQYSQGAIKTSDFLYFVSFLTAGVSFAARDYISNFFSSIGILLSAPFSKGDIVAVYDVEGRVESFGFQQTILRQKDQSLVYIANAQLMTTRLFINKSRILNQPIHITFYLATDVNEELLNKIFKRILDFLSVHEKMVKNNKPSIFVDDIVRGVFKIQLTTFIKNHENKDEVKQNILFFIRDILREEKITFMPESY